MDEVFCRCNDAGMEKTILQQRVEERLTALNLKPATVSLRIGRSNSFVRDLLRKGSMPKASSIAALADALETTPAYLLGETDISDKGDDTTVISGHVAALCLSTADMSCEVVNQLLMIGVMTHEQAVAILSDLADHNHDLARKSMHAPGQAAVHERIARRIEHQIDDLRNVAGATEDQQNPKYAQSNT